MKEFYANRNMLWELTFMFQIVKLGSFSEINILHIKIFCLFDMIWEFQMTIFIYLGLQIFYVHKTCRWPLNNIGIKLIKFYSSLILWQNKIYEDCEDY